MVGYFPILSFSYHNIGVARKRPLTKTRSFELAEKFALMFTMVAGLLDRVLSVGILKLYLRSLRHPETEEPYIDATLYQHRKPTAEILENNHTSIHCIHTYLRRSLMDSVVMSVSVA